MAPVSYGTLNASGFASALESPLRIHSERGGGVFLKCCTNLTALESPVNGVSMPWPSADDA